jgi:hypothetical protein
MLHVRSKGGGRFDAETPRDAEISAEKKVDVRFVFARCLLAKAAPGPLRKRSETVPLSPFLP